MDQIEYLNNNEAGVKILEEALYRNFILFSVNAPALAAPKCLI